MFTTVHIIYFWFNYHFSYLKVSCKPTRQKYTYDHIHTQKYIRTYIHDVFIEGQFRLNKVNHWPFIRETSHSDNDFQTPMTFSISQNNRDSLDDQGKSTILGSSWVDFTFISDGWSHYRKETRVQTWYIGY